MEKIPERNAADAKDQKVSFQMKGQKRCIQQDLIFEDVESLSAPAGNP